MRRPPSDVLLYPLEYSKGFSACVCHCRRRIAIPMVNWSYPQEIVKDGGTCTPFTQQCHSLLRLALSCLWEITFRSLWHLPLGTNHPNDFRVVIYYWSSFFHWPLVSKSTILKHSQKQLILKLTGWVRWRPSMLCVLNLCWVFYFLCRYCMLFSFIGLWVKPGPLLRGAFWLSTTRIISLAVTTQVSARSSSLYTDSWGVKDQLPCR